ncbi:MAG: glnE, partial [Herminiimonas sp.]|nr:glnE [Herminiimonas sp.]
VTGRAEDVSALEAIVRPFVYRRYLDYGAIDAMRSMHAQIRAEVVRQETRHPDRSNNVKLGRGGIREIEFLAQVFQLIRGGRDAELRDRSTRKTLGILAQKRLLEEDVVKGLLAAYTFLRNLEHRLQYLDDAQTHNLPANPDDQFLVAQMMGYDSTDALLHALEEHRLMVATQFDAIFSEPRVIGGSSSANSDGSNNDSGSADAHRPAPPLLNGADTVPMVEAQLSALAFDQTADMAQRLHATWNTPRLLALPETSRNQLLALLNAALPIVARTEGTPSKTLARLLDFFEAIARRAAYLALLTEYPHALLRLIRMMAASDWAAKYLTRHPLLLDELLDDRNLQATPDWSAFASECRRELESVAGDTERQMDVLREMHHGQQFRMLGQDLAGGLTVERLADHLSALADVIVGATLYAVWQSIPIRHVELPQFAVIAYGKLGGKELGYASDLDVIFLYDDEHPDAPMLYAKLAQRFITWMTAHTPAGILFDIDIALRPDGASGLLVSPFSAFEKYQKGSAWVWEHQALTRARFCAGDAEIGARFESLRETVLRQPREEALLLRNEILSMRKKMHDAHPNRSELFDLKHDAGGMIDIEFIVQYLVLRHAARFPKLVADIGNIALLKLSGALGLIDPNLAEDVANAYRAFRRLQHQIRMKGEDRARVPHAQVSDQARRVTELFKRVLG